MHVRGTFTIFFRIFLPETKSSAIYINPLLLPISETQSRAVLVCMCVSSLSNSDKTDFQAFLYKRYATGSQLDCRTLSFPTNSNTKANVQTFKFGGTLAPST
jgi:hypothetical protein